MNNPQSKATLPDSSFLVFEERRSDSRFVERVWRSHSENAGTLHSIAACHWEMVVSRFEGKTSMIVRGPETQVSTAQCPAGGEWFAIRFKLGTFMPALRPGSLQNRNDVILPDASSKSFWLDGSAWEYPNFENAEIFVQRLMRKGLVIEDPLVTSVLRGEPNDLTERTEQRRFVQVTGMTRGTIEQIERARRATHLLKAGMPLLEAGLEAGYYDQAHFTRSLKRWIGQTPAQVARAEEQLSFLYNTEPR